MDVARGLLLIRCVSHMVKLGCRNFMLTRNHKLVLMNLESGLYAMSFYPALLSLFLTVSYRFPPGPSIRARGG